MSDRPPMSNTTPTSPKQIADRHIRSPQPVRWLFAGDSITQGAVHTNGWRDYTQWFKERLGEIGRNEDIVINTSVGGWTLPQFASRLDDRVFAYQPHVVLLMFGTNDALGGNDQVPEFRRLYEQVLHNLSDRGIDLIVQTTVPVCPVDPDQFAQARYVDEATRKTKAHGLRIRQRSIGSYVEATIQAAQSRNVAIVDHFAAWKPFADRIERLTDGGFHPNHAGHRLIARTLISELGLSDDSNSMTLRSLCNEDLI